MSDTKELIERLQRHAAAAANELEDDLLSAIERLAAQGDTIARLEAERDAARGVRVSIPTETMEQEFSAHHRRGYAKGRREAMEECARLSEGNRLLSGSPGPLFDVGWATAIKSCAAAIRAAMEKP